MAKKEKDPRREYRRRRRIRNQLLAWLVLIVLLAGLGAGAYYATDYLMKHPKKTTAEPVSSDNADTEPTPEESISGGTIGTPENVDELLEEPEPTEAEPETDPAVMSLIEDMTVEQKVDALFIVSPEAITNVDRATRAGDATKSGLEQYAVGGVLYSAGNIDNGDQFKEMVSATKEIYKEIYNRKLLTFVYEDCGNMTLAGKINGLEGLPAASELAAGSETDVKTAYAAVGAYLKGYDIDGDLAPLAAVLTDENGYLKDRAFSSDAATAAVMTGAAVEGLNGGGVISCLNAFPGEGSLSTDPEKGAASTDRSLDDMRSSEFLPFSSGIEAGADMVMVSNMSAQNAADNGDSCIMSEKLIKEVLREELGFKGVIVTAPLEQAGMSESGKTGNAVLRSFRAGADMFIIRSHDDLNAARQVLTDAVADGTVSEEALDEALIRIYTMRLNKSL